MTRREKIPFGSVISLCAKTFTFIIHYMQVEHFQESISKTASFEEIAFVGAGSLAPYLMQLYFTIVSNSVKKHSARPLSDKVHLRWYCSIIIYACR